MIKIRDRAILRCKLQRNACVPRTGGPGYHAAMLRICILSPDSGHRDYAPMWPTQARILTGALALAGIAPDFVPWTDEGGAAAQLSRYHLVMPLLACGYHDAPEHWCEAVDSWEGNDIHLANPPNILRWNHDKSYLISLAGHGAHIVPSLQTDRATPADLDLARSRFGNVEIIAKPAISASARGIVRILPGEDLPEAVAGHRMLFQPMQSSIADEGEYSLFWFAGRYSHAVVKRPRAGDFRVQTQYGGRDIAVAPPAIAVAPPATALATATTALALIDAPLLYARVDLVGDGMGGHALMEIELIEPQLFLDQAPDGGRMFAETVRTVAMRNATLDTR